MTGRIFWRSIGPGRPNQLVLRHECGWLYSKEVDQHVNEAVAWCKANKISHWQNMADGILIAKSKDITAFLLRFN